MKQCSLWKIKTDHPCGLVVIVPGKNPIQGWERNNDFHFGRKQYEINFKKRDCPHWAIPFFFI
jgi:hypothetical protein